MRNIIGFVCFSALLLLGAAICHAAENKPVIVFDEGHGERFTINDQGDLQLSKLAETMRASGAQVTKTKDALSDDSLKGASALVISGLFKPLQADEVEAIARFIRKGGRLAVMMHIAPPLSNLIYRFNLGYSVTVIHERQNIIDKDINFRLTDLAPHPLFKGIDYFSAYGVWAIDPGDAATAIARTSPSAWLDLVGNGILSKDDLVQAMAVAVTGSLGSGNYVIFGDDAIFQNRFLKDNNQILAANLTKWLARL